jgi:hypothetical protein
MRWGIAMPSFQAVPPGDYIPPWRHCAFRLAVGKNAKTARLFVQMPFGKL